MVSDWQLRLREKALLMTKPLKVFQQGVLMGTVPLWPPQSTSGIFTVIEAHCSIGPGDLRCLAGFRLINGNEPPSEPFAAEYDTHIAGGAGPLEALEAVIGNALGKVSE